MAQSRRINFESGVNLEGEPFIHINWGNERGQLTPEEAVRHALGIIETAQGAITDAFFLKFLRDRLNIPINEGAVLMKDFREFREARVSTWRPPDTTS